MSAIGVVRVVGILLATVCSNEVQAADTYEFHHEEVMGTSLELRVIADSAAAARWAEGRVLEEIDRLSAIFNSYDPRSELSRWQAAPRSPLKVSPELFEVLRLSDHFCRISGGAFDPRVEALSRLWSQGARRDRRPTDEELAEARSLMKPDAWKLDSSAVTAERLSDCPISLNAIAKGFIVERSCEAAMDRGKGVRGLLLNVGGDMRVRGDLVRTIGVADPSADSETSAPIATVQVRDRAVSTSGRSQRGFSIGGHWYSHKIDPSTGEPVDRVASATVISDHSADADALATIFNVLLPEQGLRLADELPGIACLIVTGDGRLLRSARWPVTDLLLGNPRASGAKTLQGSPAGGPAAPDSGEPYEMLLTFEISRPGGDARRYRRPYVAIWAEDQDGFPVRTLTLWVQANGPGPRWIPDLKRWYKDDQTRRLVDETDMVATVARPTRPPGKYDIIWDLKDDQGKKLEPGEYVLNIEAAREHGTYQTIRKTVRLGDHPFKEELKGNVEIKSASIEYRRKPAKK
ncbi:MAG: DUF2271 domain-containing protein [Isosphaeraceae bacterium]